MKLKKVLSFIGCTLLTFTSVFTNLSNCFATRNENYITKIDVDINNIDDIGRKFDELCNQFNCSHGIYIDDRLPGWEQSAYQYFFGIICRYDYMPLDDKLTFAQCIEAMYLNKDNPVWHDITENILILLSTHGGHCPWRAVSLVKSSYEILNRFLRNSGIDHDISDNDEIELLNE